MSRRFFFFRSTQRRFFQRLNVFKSEENLNDLLTGVRRQIRQSLLAQWSLKQIFGGFIVRSNVSVVFSIFVFIFSLFVREACSMRAYIRRKVSTYSRTHKKREKKKIKFFFLRFKENLKCDWHRHRHIPSMEYFMQNTNKTFEANIRKNTTWVLLIQSAIILCAFSFIFQSLALFISIVVPQPYCFWWHYTLV